MTHNSQWFTIALIPQREQKGIYQNICGGRMYSLKKKSPWVKFIFSTPNLHNHFPKERIIYAI